MKILIIGADPAIGATVAKALIGCAHEPFLVVSAQAPPEELPRESLRDFGQSINELILNEPLYKVEELEELEPWVFESLREGRLKPLSTLKPQQQPNSVFKLNRFREWKEKKL